MRTLLLLLLILIVPFLVLGLVGRLWPQLRISPRTRARAGLSLFFAFTGLGHFILTNQMAQMLPPSVPYRVELIYLTACWKFWARSEYGCLV